MMKPLVLISLLVCVSGYKNVGNRLHKLTSSTHPSHHVGTSYGTDYDKSADYDKTNVYDKTTDYEKTTAYDKPASYDKTTDYVKTVYDKVADYEKPTTYDKTTDYVKTVYDKVADYDKTTSYDKTNDYIKTIYDKTTGYDKVSDYDKPTSYDKINDYDKTSVYDKTNDYVKTVYDKVSDYDKPTSYDKTNDYDKPTGYDKTSGYVKNIYDKTTDYDKYNTYDKPYDKISSYYKTSVEPEYRTIDEIYKAALNEGGKLVIYAGGDAPGQQTGAKAAFESRFPGIELQMIVDYSKIHDARIDNQLATGTLVADVVQQQTLQDFDRWRDEGVLHPYKPLGWEEVYPEFKDPYGYSTGIHVWAFANNIHRGHLGDDESNWPTEANDYLDPALKGKIISTYPNDDDAVLFIYKQFIDKYGWEWLEKFVANKPVFVRSTQIPSDQLHNSSFPVSFTTAGALKPQITHPVQFVLPKYDPFVSWGQRAAIMAGTKYLATAQLYLSWWLEVETQRDFWFQWSVRKDVPAPKGYKKIMEYQGQTDPVAFERFMSDRKALEIFKNQVQMYVGEVYGEVPTGTWELGRHPTRMLDAAFDRK